MIDVNNDMCSVAIQRKNQRGDKSVPDAVEKDFFLICSKASPVFVLPPPTQDTVSTAFSTSSMLVCWLSVNSVLTPTSNVSRPTCTCVVLNLNFLTTSLTKLSIILKSCSAILPELSRRKTISPFVPQLSCPAIENISSIDRQIPRLMHNQIDRLRQID